MSRAPTPKAKVEAFKEAYRISGRLDISAKEAGIPQRTAIRLKKKLGLNSLDDLKAPAPEEIVEGVVKKIESMPSVKDKSFDILARKLGAKNIVAVLRDPKRFDETTREVARIAFMRVMVEMLDDEKLREASLASLSSVVPVLADAASGKYKFIDGGVGNAINSEEVLLKLQMSVRRIKQFNPALSEEVSKAVDSFTKLDKKQIKEAKYKIEKEESTGENTDSGDTGEDRE